MNRILIKDFLLEIWHTRKRFLSIFLIVALGCGFFAGIFVTGSDMKHTLDTYFDETNYMDAEVISPYGLTEGDIEAIRSLSSVEDVDPGYFIDVFLNYNEVHPVARFHSYKEGETMEQFVLVEGRLPQAPGECLMESEGALSSGLPTVGDTFTIAAGSEKTDLSDVLARDTFTVVGTVDSPLYFSTQKGNATIGSGTLDAYVFVPASEFTMEEYVVAYVHGTNTLDTFSTEGKQQAKLLANELKTTSSWRGPLRYEELVDKVTDAQETLEEEEQKALDEIADAEEKLADAQVELADGEKEYEEGLAEFHQEIADAQEELADAKVKIDDGWEEYEEGKLTYHKEIGDAQEELRDAKTKLEEGEELYLEGRNDYLEGYREYKENRKLFQSMEKTARPALRDGRNELEQSKKLLDTSREQLDQVKKEIEEGKKLLSLGEQELQEAKKVLEEGKAQLEGARQMKSLLQRVLQTAPYLTPEQIQQIVEAVAVYDSSLADAVAFYIAEIQASGSSSMEVVIEEAIDTLDDEITAGEAEIAAGEAELAAGEAELDAQREQLLQGEAEYLVGEEQYAGGLALYQAGLAEIEAGERQLEDASHELLAAKNTLVAADTKLKDAYAELEDGKKEYADGLKELEDAKAEGWETLEEAREDLEEGEKEYKEGLQELEDARIEGQQELDDALIELEDGRSKIEDALQEVADGKVELRETITKHQKDIDDAKEVIEDITEIKWMVESRDQQYEVKEFGTNAERIDAIGSVFPYFFLAIAVLVSLTTMTRMVEDQRTQVGTLKSLGYSNIAIVLKFIGYAFLASFFGSIFGLFIGLKLFPTLIYSAFASILYKTPAIILQPHWEVIIPTVVVAIAATTLSTFLVCYRMLMEQPAQLLRPAAPKPGKRILLERVTFLWKRLKFNQKVTLRNLFRYKRRMLMSVVGVAGCTALMLAGFGLQDAIGGFIDAQFEDITRYNMQIVYDEEEDNTQAFQQVAEMEGIESITTLHLENLTVPSQNGFEDAQDATMMVFDEPEDISGMVTLIDIYTDDRELSLAEDGAIITEKMAKLYSLKPGDTFTVELDGYERELTVADIANNYLFHYIYITKPYFEKVFQEVPPPNQQLLKVNRTLLEDPSLQDALAEEILHNDDVLAVIQTKNLVEATTDLMASLDTIVIVLIISAGLLAFIVMYNLTNINIIERRREIATLKVLGFYDRETSSYVSGENMILSFIGALVGLVLGYYLSHFITSVAEVDNMQFLKHIHPRSFVFALALTILFTLVVRFISHFQLKKIDMIESLQSVE